MNTVEEAKITISFEPLDTSCFAREKWARTACSGESVPIGARGLRDLFSGPAAAIATGKKFFLSRFMPPVYILLYACENGIILKNTLGLYTPSLCNKLDDPTHTHRSFAAVVQGIGCEIHLNEEERLEVFDDIRDLLMNVAKRIHIPFGAWPDVSKEVIATLGQLSFFAPQSVTIKTFMSMWQDPDGSGLLLFFAGLHKQDRLDEESVAGQLCKEVLAQADTNGKPQRHICIFG